MATVSLIGIILVQRSASDGMGLSGGSSNSFMSGRTAASFVTHTTAILAAVFIITSLCLGIITAHSHNSATSIMDKVDPLSPTQQLAPQSATPSTTAPAQAPAAAATVTPKTIAKPVKQPAVPRPE
jgi:preprotein translocase subunit SecG